MNKTKDLAKARAKSTAIAATVFLIPALALIAIYMIYPVIDTLSPVVISGTVFLPIGFLLDLTTGKNF